MKHWTESEVRLLSGLRAGFLDGSAGRSDYWRDREAVALYDRTFGARIGWKWEAVLAELERRGWGTGAQTVVDLGCGSGVGTRTVLGWGAKGGGVVREGRGGRSVELMDRSPVACAYSAERLREMAGAPARVRCAGSLADVAVEGALVLVSHVLTELSEADLAAWVATVRRAQTLIWVDAGTREVSRRLVDGVREPLRSAGWRVVAPCTHSEVCPLRGVAMERHWCHHFARVPAEVHQDAAWRELSLSLGIDLRVLPYSFLVMEAPDAPPGAPLPAGAARVIGQPREFKGYLRVLSCAEGQSGDWMLQKRDAPEAFRRLVRGRGPSLYRWEISGDRILRADPVEGGQQSGDPGESDADGG